MLYNLALINFSSTPNTASKLNIKLKQTYMGIRVNRRNVADIVKRGYASDTLSYTLSMMGGWEYDLARYSNYIVEPCEEIKNMLGLVKKKKNDENDKTTPTIPNYVQMSKTSNNGESLIRHPLFESTKGLCLADNKEGSFWQFPVRLTNGNDTEFSGISGTTSDIGKPRNGEITRIPIDFTAGRRQFFSAENIKSLLATRLARGGEIKNSSIRIEMPTFLENSYSARGSDFQEHANFTIDSVALKHLTSTSTTANNNLRRERKRLAYFDVSQQTNAQPIKKKKSSTADIHFFLVDGSRPRQKDKGQLVDSNPNTIFAPFRNVQASINTPKLSEERFRSIQKNDFLAVELNRQRKSRRCGQLDAKSASEHDVNTLQHVHVAEKTLDEIRGLDFHGNVRRTDRDYRRYGNFLRASPFGLVNCSTGKRSIQNLFQQRRHSRRRGEKKGRGGV